MAEENAAEKKEAAAKGEDTEKGEEAASEEGAKGGKKKKLILLGGVLALLLIIIPAVLYFTGIIGGKHTAPDKGHSEAKGGEEGGGEAKKGENATPSVDPNLPPPPVTLELPEFLVNLNTAGKQPRFLKMTIALELPSEKEKEEIKPYLPRIRDSFQIYLRELREEDVKGAAALYRLREEMMLRVSKVVYPIKVNDILFKEILTQ